MTRLFLLAIALLAGTASAQTTIPYQGYLTEADGTPLTGSAELTFTLWTAATGGSPTWGEAQTVSLDDGVFSVQLGAEDSFAPDEFDRPLYLGVSIDGGEELPRVPLGAAGTALGLRFPVAGSNTTNAPALQIDNTGGGIGVVVSSEGVGAVTASGAGDATIGLLATAAGTGAAVEAVNTGSGAAGVFRVSNAASAETALAATTEGTGPALTATSTNDDGGLAIRAQTTGSGGAAIEARHTGDVGFAGTFLIDNPDFIGAALLAQNEADGPAVLGVSSGDGIAIEAAANGPGTGLFARRSAASGDGHVAEFVDGDDGNTEAAVVITAESQVLAVPALRVEHAGRGTGGRFEITSTTGAGTGVYATTRGPGVGLHGQTTGSGTLAVGAWAHAASSSDAVPLRVSQDGSGTDIAVFQATTGVNQARIDRFGTGFFNGGVQSSGADVAEAFAVEGPVEAYEPGDVLVISTRTDRTVEKSAEAYSSLVVGVYATRPGLVLTERGIDEGLDGLVPMGVVGVLPTKVTTENGPIRRGDLLVTAATPGHAMRADPAALRVGVVLGKALEGFDGEGSGLVRVLVNTK
jgi:hypothetical protein